VPDLAVVAAVASGETGEELADILGAAESMVMEQ